MTKPKKILRIDSLQNVVAGQIELGGKTHDVLQLSLRRQQALLAPDPESPNDFESVFENVRAAVPSLTEDEIGNLNFDQTQAILALASANIDAVERMFPNAVSPETAPTSPG